MPRLSMWREKKGNDYKWFDKQIRNMYDVSGTGILVHKYLGPKVSGFQTVTSAAQLNVNDPLVFSNTTGINPNDFVYGANIPTGAQVISMNSTSIILNAATSALVPTGTAIGFSNDATKPAYPTTGAGSIQDILFLENRDRDYDEDVYVMRGIYQRTDNDFDLTQFGLFLQTGTVIMTFHHNEMIEILGRRLMNGDVLEFMHLKDDYAFSTEAALKRFYVVGDCSWATEGFSPTWYPHLWRCKLNPMVDSQEYKDILDNIYILDTTGPMGTPSGNSTPIVDIISTYDKYIGINEAIIDQANADVPASGYDVSKIYAPHVDAEEIASTTMQTADDTVDTADETTTADEATYSPSPGMNPKGYLSGDGIAPDGFPVQAGIAFPLNPSIGDYYLRLDYLPNRLFRFSGTRWAKMEDNVRTNLTPGDASNRTLRNSFANPEGTAVDPTTITLSNGDVVPTRQNLNEALRPKADY